jgi:hypothetical protein
MQDYDLWVRLLASGYNLANIPEVLVLSEVSEDWYARRGGIDYAKIEYDLLIDFWKMGFINTYEFLINICTKLPMRLSPSFVRKIIYSNILR